MFAQDITIELVDEEINFVKKEYKDGVQYINATIYTIKERIKELQHDLAMEENELLKHQKEFDSGDFAKKVLPIYHNNILNGKEQQNG